VAQRLARKICANCKEEVKLPDQYIAEVKEDLKKIGLDYVKTVIPDFDIEKMKFHKGKGCSHCGNTGYAGRLSVAETLTVTDHIKEQILAGERALKIEDIKADQTFITVKQDGIIKAVQGITTLEEVFRVMRD
jgi:type II secretory ATPase GspE/PulE/Tfp pilus assembly ATPase PilB-like protein